MLTKRLYQQDSGILYHYGKRRTGMAESMFQTLVDGRDDMYHNFIKFYNALPDHVVQTQDIVYRWNNEVLAETQPPPFASAYEVEDGEILPPHGRSVGPQYF